MLSRGSEQSVHGERKERPVEAVDDGDARQLRHRERRGDGDGSYGESGQDVQRRYALGCRIVASPGAACASDRGTIERP